MGIKPLRDNRLFANNGWQRDNTQNKLSFFFLRMKEMINADSQRKDNGASQAQH